MNYAIEVLKQKEQELEKERDENWDNLIYIRQAIADLEEKDTQRQIRREVGG